MSSRALFAQSAGMPGTARSIDQARRSRSRVGSYQVLSRASLRTPWKRASGSSSLKEITNWSLSPSQEK